jgi:hypothetical protein
MMREIILCTASGLMDDGFSPVQIAAMMAGISARMLHTAGHPGAIDAVVDQLRKAAADSGLVGTTVN